MMKKDNPYSAPEDGGGGGSRSGPLFWTRMLRLSIYFTIFGVGLAFIKMQLSLNIVDAGDGSEVERMSQSIDGIHSSIRLALTFAVMGGTCIIVSAVMRSREKRLLGNDR